MKVGPDQRYCYHHRNGCDNTIYAGAGAGAGALNPSYQRSPNKGKESIGKEMKELQNDMETLDINDYEDYSQMNPLLSSLLGQGTTFLPIVSMIQEYTAEYYKTKFSYKDYNGTIRTRTIFIKTDPIIYDTILKPSLGKKRHDMSIKYEEMLQNKRPELFDFDKYKIVLIQLEEVSYQEYSNAKLKMELEVKDVYFNFKDVSAYWKNDEYKKNTSRFSENFPILSNEYKLMEDAEYAIETKDYKMFEELFPRLRLRHLNLLYDKIPPNDLEFVGILLSEGSVILNIKSWKFNQYIVSVLENAVLNGDINIVRNILSHLEFRPESLVLLYHLMDIAKQTKNKKIVDYLEELVDNVFIINKSDFQKR
jgi:hypothetical protein